MLRRIKIDWTNLPQCNLPETPFPEPAQRITVPARIDPETYPAFLDEIGLVGMGGSGFPASTKVRAGIDAHTLVINGVECEPGVTIDQSILLHHHKWVVAGARASAEVIGAKQIVLATKNKPEQLALLQQRYPEFKIVHFPNRYPSGAEKLIVRKLSGKMPPPGVRPYQLGYLIQNAITLRAIGRALLDGIPVLERPLTLTMPSTGIYRNIVVPVGQPICDVLDIFKLPYHPDKHLIVDSGLMMGREVKPEDQVTKTTLSLIVLERGKLERNERPCIRCGACNTSCPLGLHPYSLMERIKKGKTKSNAFQMQMTECFLCGVCTAVCPSDIPLQQVLEEGKQCL